MLFGMGLIVQAVLGLTGTQLTWMLIGIGLFALLYTTLGGVQAVIWNDVLQTIIFGVGMLIVLFLTIGRIEGGWSTVFQFGLEHDKFQMFNMDFSLFERRNFYTACAFALFMYLPGYTVSQTTAQRYVCMSSLGEARRALLISSLVSTSVCLLFFLVGTSMFTFYHQPGAGGFPELFRQDQLLPYFVGTEIRLSGLIGLLIAGLFAATMSTIDSGINSMTAVVVYDWLPGRKVSLGLSRLICCFIGLFVIAAALIAPYLGEHLIEIISKIAGTFLGLLLGIFLLGMFASGANTAGTFIGFLGGVVALIIVWTQTTLPHWWYGGVTVFTTVGLGVLANSDSEPLKTIHQG